MQPSPTDDAPPYVLVVRPTLCSPLSGNNVPIRLAAVQSVRQASGLLESSISPISSHASPGSRIPSPQISSVQVGRSQPSPHRRTLPSSHSSPLIRADPSPQKVVSSQSTCEQASGVADLEFEALPSSHLFFAGVLDCPSPQKLASTWRPGPVIGQPSPIDGVAVVARPSALKFVRVRIRRSTPETSVEQVPVAAHVVQPLSALQACRRSLTLRVQDPVCRRRDRACKFAQAAVCPRMLLPSSHCSPLIEATPSPQPAAWCSVLQPSNPAVRSSRHRRRRALARVQDPVSRRFERAIDSQAVAPVVVAVVDHSCSDRGFRQPQPSLVPQSSCSRPPGRRIAVVALLRRVQVRMTVAAESSSGVDPATSRRRCRLFPSSHSSAGTRGFHRRSLRSVHAGLQPSSGDRRYCRRRTALARSSDPVSADVRAVQSARLPTSASP